MNKLDARIRTLRKRECANRPDAERVNVVLGIPRINVV
jgi:hypothetical protein